LFLLIFLKIYLICFQQLSRKLRFALLTRFPQCALKIVQTASQQPSAAGFGRLTSRSWMAAWSCGNRQRAHQGYRGRTSGQAFLDALAAVEPQTQEKIIYHARIPTACMGAWL